MRRSRLVIYILLIAVMFVSFIGMYAGRFLFAQKGGQKISAPKKQKPFPVMYKCLETVVNKNKQVINLLEIDISDGRASILPVLSFDSLFGFDKLSSMASDKGAYAAVNAGFFYEYGRPAGLVCIDGKLISNSTGMYPVFMIKNGRAHLSQVRTKLWIVSKSERLLLDNINTQGKPGEVIVYTREYGKVNRVKGNNITVKVENGIITEIAAYKGSVDIPGNGMLLTVFGENSGWSGRVPFKKGDRVEFTYSPDVGTQAYECGSWIVRDGKAVIGDRDAWVGVLTNRDPRTAIGIKNDGKVVLVTIDGRQPGHSTGMTGKELGSFLVNYGIRNAAMLDGGASTTMITNGEIVNKPSYKGRERPLGGGIIVKVEDCIPGK